MECVSYLNCRLRQPRDRGKRLFHFNVRILGGGEGPFQLPQLRLAESGALPAALGVWARLEGSIMMSCGGQE